MKTIQHFFFLTLVTLSLAAKSQFTKGDRFIGGSVSFEVNNNNYTFQPNPTLNNAYSGTSLNPRFSWATSAKHLQGIILNCRDV